MTQSPGFPSSLAWWRKKRGFSQLRLALAAACSQRHISFLELGRTRPSRDMVLRLAATLELSLRQSNELLLGAGFAPVWAFIRTVEAEAAADAATETANLLKRLVACKDVRAAIGQTAVGADGPVLPMHFRKGRTDLRLFTTISTLGNPLDVTLQELRVEAFFPIDDATRAAFRTWARRTPRGGKGRSR